MRRSVSVRGRGRRGRRGRVSQVTRRRRRRSHAVAGAGQVFRLSLNFEGSDMRRGHVGAKPFWVD
jgi:hypothetical protein